MKGKKLLSLLLAAGVTAGLLGGCAPRSISETRLTVSGEEVPVKGYLFHAGKYGVTLDEYRCYYLSLRDTQEYGETEETISAIWDDEMQNALKKQAVSYAVSAMALRKLADDYHIKITDEDEEAFEKDLAEQRELYGDAFETDFMDARHYTMGVYKELFFDTVRYRKLYHLLYDEGGEGYIDDAALLEYFHDAYFTFRQIMTPGDEEGQTVNMEKIYRIRQQLDDGGDFEALQAEFDADPYRDDHPNGYTVTFGDVDEDVEDELSMLTIGEVSSVFGAGEYYMILKRYPLDESFFEPNKADIYNHAAERDMNSRRKQIMEEMLDSLEYQDVYGEITVDTLN